MAFIPEELFIQILDNVPIVCVDVLPFTPDFKNVLLALRNNEPKAGSWFATGGRMLKNETFESAAIRQAKRELGMDIEQKDLIFGGVINEIWDNSAFKGVTYHAVTVYFGIQCRKITVFKTDEQHNNVRWFDVDDIAIDPLVQERIHGILQRVPL